MKKTRCGRTLGILCRALRGKKTPRNDFNLPETPLMPSKRLFFIHIPFTTGRVLSRALIANYGFRNIFAGYGMQAPGNDAAVRFLSCTTKLVYLDHAPRSILGEKCLSGNIVMTMLRDPVERVLDIGAGAHAEECSSGDMHTAYLCAASGDANAAAGNLHSAVSFLEGDNVLFGISEMYEESLALFSLLLGWDKLRSARAAMPQPEFSAMPYDQDALRQAMGICGDDIVLYEAAKNIFQQRVDALGEIFSDRLAYIRGLGHRAEPVFELSDSAA